MMISDNAKTFKAASKILRELLETPVARKYFSQIGVKWKFNLEKAPWWGGLFERMIKSAKRCLKKSVGKNCLFYDELITLVIEVEAVLNSRPLTYVSSEDIEEPLTPSHLLVGFRVLTLPDPATLIDHDPDFTCTPGALSHRRTHLSRILQHFWRRWKAEYLLELREFHRAREERGSKYIIQVGDIVTVYDESHPRGLWRLVKVESLIRGADGIVRGANLKVLSKKGIQKTIRRPLQHIYPLEVRNNLADTTKNTNSDEPDIDSPSRERPIRNAASQARARILQYVTDQEH